ncbi:MAG TPA: YCF48-related protein, partial [Candidatus Polarisedimenticolia bacterium]|nr:YCF48-related protein [Candidatus Polarisedimenticolia bacterium]
MNPWNMLLGLSLALPSLATAQTWTLQASDPTAVPLKGVFTVSLDEAWAIGEQGVLVHTEDAGRTWSKTILSPPVGMSNVTFVDPQHGWAVGNAVFRTTDGGATWQRVSFTHGTLGAVFFLDRFVGWTCDRWNVFRTKDGGITWEALPRPSARGASSFFFFDLQNGWLVTPWGDIEKTADGGQTWTVVETVGDLLSHVWFLDATEGWAVGGNTAMHTGDGGASWQRRSFPSTERVGSATFVAPSVPGGDPVSYAAGVGGCVVKSLDGWRTYSVVRPVGSGPLLWHVQFADADHGFVVGDYGVLLYTNDGGANWYSRQSGGPGGFHRMDANDPAHAWLAADLGNVFFTTDGGIRWRWTLVAGFSQYGTIQSVDFLDDNLTGWATGVEQAWGGNTSRISRSLDGGRTWQLQFTSTIDFFFETIDALDEETAVASG